MNMENDKLIKLSVLFYICSILGYFYELFLNYLKNHKIFSHGFLNGPWLPIYGTGAVILTLLDKYKNHPLTIFVLSFFLTGLVEYTGGLILLKILKMRLWDYTGMFLNIDGLVCFLSAFCFGIGGLLIIYLVYPLIEKIIKKIDKRFLKNLLTLITIIFSSDIIATILK